VAISLLAVFAALILAWLLYGFGGFLVACIAALCGVIAAYKETR
jgi:predicted PurR-regulated permease PerM